MGPDATPRFAVDRTLGRLARWLRVLGHDVAHAPRLDGRAHLALARREGRILLTRDTRLCRQPAPRHLVVRSNDFRAQLREVAAAVPLGRERVLGRCLGCNRELAAVPRARARMHVPPYVWETHERFLHCAGCNRFYWPATHHARMLAELAALGLGPGPDSGPTSRTTDEPC
jgi:uncharacterized protein with PIN domain